MRSEVIVLLHPGIEILLEFLNSCIDLFPQNQPLGFFVDGLVEPLANPVCLRALILGFAVLQVIENQEQLTIVLIGSAPKIRAFVSQNSK